MDPNEHFPASSRTTRQKTPNDSASTASVTSASSARNPHDMAPQKPAAQHAAKGAKSATPARPPAKLQDNDRATRTSSKDSLKAKQLKKPDDQPKPDKNEELLKVFRSDLDSLRSLVTCKICDRLLYEPYVISCGHTYCYSIREMTSIFINRAELLPSGETQDLHKQWQKEEADIVLQDKNSDDVRTGGLFKGCFRVRAEPGLRAIRDEEDGVDRCPMCAWELEDGECAHFGGFSDMDETSEHDMSGEDLDGDLELDDNEADLDFDGYDDGLDGWADGFDDDHSASLVSDMMTEDTEMGNIEEEDEDEEDGDSSMNDFIDDDPDSTD
ncbi:putative ring finger domain-containing protein [Neofusicoccum parvum UCRNP2]|uniref:Putative ring finger domain-containing protein n=1 Tax=Botryosphaeria parva (strain UCR-NP2) TaxID=1287680 RepID=R1EKH6_BOTPV|nr:putative ring finger domain-containing protein [Neofusicoccum parvum UCRNP2]